MRPDGRRSNLKSQANACSALCIIFLTCFVSTNKINLMKENNIDNNILRLSARFQRVFYEKIYPQINVGRLEIMRYSFLVMTLLAWGVYICLCVLFYGSEPFYVFFFVGLGLVFSLYSYLARFYKTEVKKKYYQSIVKIMGLEWANKSQKELDSYIPEINKSKLFMHASHIQEDDIIYGTFQGVNLKISDARIIDEGYETKNSSEKHTPTTIFKGIIVYFDSNKKIESTTLIKPRIDSTKFLSVLSNGWIYLMLLFWTLFGGFLFFASIAVAIIDKKLPHLGLMMFGLSFFLGFGYWFVSSVILRERNHLKGLQKVNLEDVNFSKKYNAYSYNQVEGRYLLTTAFIERFTYLAWAFKNNSLRCSFVGDKIIIAIPSLKDSFEIGNLFVPLSSPKAVRSFFNQIASILYMVDYFKLDEKTNL